MSGWPWLLSPGWRLHCHAGQFPPGRMAGGIVALRPMAVADMRMPPLKWPADQHPERSRLYGRGLPERPA